MKNSDNKLISKSHYCLNGFIFTVQTIGDISHLIIQDRNLYPDGDSRSEEYWRSHELLIPINSKKDLKEIKKLF
jgi:hypothetical protein